MTKMADVVESTDVRAVGGPEATPVGWGSDTLNVIWFQPTLADVQALGDFVWTRDQDEGQVVIQTPIPQLGLSIQEAGIYMGWFEDGDLILPPGSEFVGFKVTDFTSSRITSVEQLPPPPTYSNLALADGAIIWGDNFVQVNLVGAEIFADARLLLQLGFLDDSSGVADPAPVESDDFAAPETEAPRSHEGCGDWHLA